MRNTLFSIFFFMCLGVPFSAQADTENLDDFQIPLFQRKKPQWGVEITTTLNAFGTHALTPSQGSTPAYGLTFHLEYQPAILQSYGVLSLGPSFALYPISGGITPSLFSLLSVGGRVLYQARYWREQPIVPMLGYAVEYLNFHFNSGIQGSTLLKGPVLGLWMLLNVLESTAAAQMYMSTGISRSYLVLEWRNLHGESPDLAIIDGGSYYLGLRFEF